MARISKSNIYAINWLAQQNKTKEEIAEELKLSIDQVSKALEKFNASNKDGATIKTAHQPSSKSKSLMINTTMGKKTNTVAIMTKEASEYNDATKNKEIPANAQQNRYMKDGIFIPSESKKNKRN
jgi:DNA-binding transcriptional regulator GbsR (MarR family)